MAAGDLTTLAAVKAFLPGQTVAPGPDDALLASLITRASTYVQSWLNRNIASQAYTQQFSGMGGYALHPDQFPITAVASVTIDGISIPAGSVTQAGFYFDSDAIYLNGYSFSRGLGNVAMTYTAGFVATPADIEDVCVSIVARVYKERDRIGLTTQTQGGQVTSYFTGSLTMRENNILQQYKSVVRAA